MKSVTPASRYISRPRRTVSSSPMIAMSAGPSFPSKASIVLVRREARMVREVNRCSLAGFVRCGRDDHDHARCDAWRGSPCLVRGIGDRGHGQLGESPRACHPRVGAVGVPSCEPERLRTHCRDQQQGPRRSIDSDLDVPAEKFALKVNGLAIQEWDEDLEILAEVSDRLVERLAPLREND